MNLIPINQCDGCMRNLSIKNGIHREKDGSPYIMCTRDRYRGSRYLYELARLELSSGHENIAEELFEKAKICDWCGEKKQSGLGMCSNCGRFPK